MKISAQRIASWKYAQARLQVKPKGKRGMKRQIVQGTVLVRSLVGSS